MSSIPPRTPLAELLARLGLSQDDLAARSRTHPHTVARAVRGEQVSAPVRARIVAALQARWVEQQPGELSASDIFPTG